MSEPNDPLDFLNEPQTSRPANRPPVPTGSKLPSPVIPTAKRIAKRGIPVPLIASAAAVGILVLALSAVLLVRSVPPHFETVEQLIAWLNLHGFEAHDTGLSPDNAGPLPERIVHCKGFDAAWKKEVGEVYDKNPMFGAFAAVRVANWKKTLRIATLPNPKAAGEYARYQVNSNGGSRNGIGGTAYGNFSIVGDATSVKEVSAVLGVNPFNE